MLSSEYRTINAESRLPTTDPVSWWQSFADPTLNQLVQQAVTKNLTVQKAAERIIEARANVHLRGGHLASNVNLTKSDKFNKMGSADHPFSGADVESFSRFASDFDSIWEIDLFGRIACRMKAAEAELSATEFSLADVQQTLAADVATSYLTIRLLQDQIGLTNESIELQRATAQLVGDRTDAGVSTKLDGEQVTAFLHRSIAAKAALNQQLDCEFNRLSILLGESPANLLRDFVGSGAFPTSPLIPDAGIPADLLRRRPDVRFAEAKVAAASITKAVGCPRFSLRGRIASSSTDKSSLLQPSSHTRSLDCSPIRNILHFGPICDKIEIQESRFRQTVADYRRAILAAVKEVEDALAKYDGYQTQLTAFEKARLADANAVELSLERYKVGKGNFQRVLDTQLQLLEDSQATVIARANATIQLVRLYKATGGGWSASEGCTIQGCTCDTCSCSESTVIGVTDFDSLTSYEPETQSTQPISPPTPAPAQPSDNQKETKTAPQRGGGSILISNVTVPPPAKVFKVSNSVATDLFDWGIQNDDPRGPDKSSSSHAVKESPSGTAPSNRTKHHRGAAQAMYFAENRAKRSRPSTVRQANAEIESMVWKSSTDSTATPSN
jgi:NodT family efflux transporter outer membrane factor (OMF) lipoprotein